MINLKKNLIYYLVFCLILTSISTIISFFLGFFLKDWAFIYTTLLTIPFIVCSKLFYLLVDKQVNNLKQQFKVKRLSKTKCVFKMSWIFIISNIFLVIPFIIVNLVVILTIPNNIQIDVWINKSAFNIWLCLSLILSSIIAWVVINVFVNYKRKNNKLIKNHNYS